MIIIGFMGSGKTTIAKHLQDHMFKEVIDLDDEIKVAWLPHPEKEISKAVITSMLR